MKKNKMVHQKNLSLFLLTLSLVWLTGGFINVLVAGTGVTREAIVLSPPPEVLNGDDETPLPVVLVSHQAATTSTLYLPLVFRDACASSFSYNESLAYNLTRINAALAWLSCYQGQEITVAVVDTGVDLDHPDLQANIVAGKSFVSGTSSPDDDAGHGTHVAGIIAAVGNNGGVIGVAPGARIMPVKVLDSSGSGSIYDVAAGIEWAADQGVTVINLSLGSVGNSTTLKTAVDDAYNRGILLIAAGGNCGDSSYAANGCSYQDQPLYPAAYNHVMAVASTDSSDKQSSFSTQGSYIEIAAPGSSIYSTYPAGRYATLSGTSMAAPHVAGLAALIWSQNSGWTSDQVRAQIWDTAVDLGASGWDNQFGYGRINAAAAMGTQQTGGAPAVLAEPAEPAVTAAASAPYIPGEILLKLKSGVTVDKVMDTAQISTAEVRVADTIDQLGVQKLVVTAGQERAVLRQLSASDGVEYAELNYLVTIR